jgi:hypothetical protein
MNCSLSPIAFATPEILKLSLRPTGRQNRALNDLIDCAVRWYPPICLTRLFKLTVQRRGHGPEQE